MSKSRYPWGRWLKRKRLVLVKGRDFDCQPHSMAQQVRNAAARANIPSSKLSVFIDGEKVTVQRKD